MPLPEDPRDSAASHDALRQREELARRAYAEELAKNELFNLWRLPPGRYPLLSLLIVLFSASATALAASARAPVYEALYATPTELWAGGKWWGILGSVFLHGSIMHLLLNSYWIWVFGRVVENKIGPIRYLGFFVVTAWVSSLAQFAWSAQLGVGLSGVAYALFGFLVMNRSQHREYDRLLSGNTVILFLGWLVACFPLTYFGVLNVANLAHLGGLVSGCVFGALAHPHPRFGLARIIAIGLGAISFVPLFWAPWHEPWRAAQVLRAINRDDPDATLAAFAKLRASHLENFWAVDYEVSLRLRRGEYASARDLLDRVIASGKPTPAMLNTLAWLLATCPAPEIRDGNKAVKLAKRACDDTAWEIPAVIDTLAAAYAETGDFEQAEAMAVKALAVGAGGKDTNAIQEHLEAFRARRAWREPTAPTPAEKAD